MEAVYNYRPRNLTAAVCKILNNRHDSTGDLDKMQTYTMPEYTDSFI